MGGEHDSCMKVDISGAPAIVGGGVIQGDRKKKGIRDLLRGKDVGE